MEHMRSPSKLSGPVCGVLLLLGGCALEGEIDGTADDDLVAGDLVELDGFVLEVPEPGTAVGLTVDGEEGWTTLIVDNTADRVRVERSSSDVVDPDAPEQELDPTIATAACSDTAYKFTGSRWRTGMSFWFNAASTPAGVDAARAEALIGRAATTIVTGRNDCGHADDITATRKFNGRTAYTSGAGNNSAGAIACKSDKKSVVGFRSLGSKLKAATCWWYDADRYTYEADISFHSGVKWTLADAIPAGCTDALHFESVATHEFGHAFGLDHPGSTHTALTMQPGGPCDNSKATLGRGDYRGLQIRYE
jgi:hypothetical protein